MIIDSNLEKKSFSFFFFLEKKDSKKNFKKFTFRFSFTQTKKNNFSHNFTSYLKKNQIIIIYYLLFFIIISPHLKKPGSRLFPHLSCLRADLTQPGRLAPRWRLSEMIFLLFDKTFHLFEENPETVIFSALQNWLYDWKMVSRITDVNKMTRVRYL